MNAIYYATATIEGVDDTRATILLEPFCVEMPDDTDFLQVVRIACEHYLDNCNGGVVAKTRLVKLIIRDETVTLRDSSHGNTRKTRTVEINRFPSPPLEVKVPRKHGMIRDLVDYLSK